MSVWSSISKAVSKLFRGGATAGSAAGAAGAATSVTSSVISWASAAKLAIAGGFTYLFLSGGASNVVARTLGISEPVAQVLIVFLFLVMLLLVLRYLVNYARDRFGLETEYLSRPVVRRAPRDDRSRDVCTCDDRIYDGHDDRSDYDRRYYDGSSYRGPVHRGQDRDWGYTGGQDRDWGYDGNRRRRVRCSGSR